jgi:hypothetical protein
MIDDDDGDCGATGEMKIVRGNRSTRRKRAPDPFCPPQIPHDLSRARTRATAVGSQRLTVCIQQWIQSQEDYELLCILSELALRLTT